MIKPFQTSILVMTFSIQAQNNFGLVKKLLLLQKPQQFHFSIDSTGFSSFKNYNFISK